MFSEPGLIQAGLHGLPIGHAYLSKVILDGKGPKLFGTCGSNTILVEPEEGRRWICEQVARRTTLKPNNFQRRAGIDETNFASIPHLRKWLGHRSPSRFVT